MVTTGFGDLGLGPIDQIAYVVADMDEALERYGAIYGPFRDGQTDTDDARYRGRTVSFSLRLAVNNAGPIEIELLQPVAGETPLADHLKEHGEGLHHVRFRVEGMDEKLAALESRGYQPILYKRYGPAIAFAYIETPPNGAGASTVIELLEMP